jgi:hypothetical protein
MMAHEIVLSKPGAALAQLDLVIDLVGQANAVDGQNDLRGQLLVTFQLAACKRIAHRLLDLALRGDADPLEKFAQARIEHVLIHVAPPDVYGWSGWFACIRQGRAGAFAMGCSVRHVNMTISLTFLAPKLVRAAVEGHLPRGINIARLRDSSGGMESAVRSAWVESIPIARNLARAYP